VTALLLAIAWILEPIETDACGKINLKFEEVNDSPETGLKAYSRLISTFVKSLINESGIFFLPITG
jgi:hypothetical protein